MIISSQMEQIEMSSLEQFRQRVAIRNFPPVPDPVFSDRWNAICAGQAISINDFVAVLAEHFEHNAKTKDQDKIFPRESRLFALAQELANPGTTTKPEGFDQKQQTGNEQWKFYVKKNFQLSFNPNQLSSGINRFANCVYQVMTEKEEQELLKSWYKSGRDGPYFQAPVTSLENAYIDYIKAHIRSSAEHNGHRGRDDTFEQMKLGHSSSFKKDLLRKLSERCPSCMSRVEKAIKAADIAEPKRRKAREEKKRKAGIDLVADGDDDDDYQQVSSPQKRMCKKSPNVALRRPSVQNRIQYFDPGQLYHTGTGNSNFQFEQTSLQLLTNEQKQSINSNIPTNNSADTFAANPSNPDGDDVYEVKDYLEYQRDHLIDLERFKENQMHQYINPAMLHNERTAGNSETLTEMSYPNNPLEISHTEPTPLPYHQFNEYTIEDPDQSDMERFDDEFFLDKEPEFPAPVDTQNQQMEAEQATNPKPEFNYESTDCSFLPEATDPSIFDQFFSENTDLPGTNDPSANMSATVPQQSSSSLDLALAYELIGENDPDSSATKDLSPDLSTTVSQKSSFAIDPALTAETDTEVEEKGVQGQEKAQTATKIEPQFCVNGILSPTTCQTNRPKLVDDPLHKRRITGDWYGNWQPGTGSNMTLLQIPYRSGWF